jgi:hypothetical protein
VGGLIGWSLVKDRDQKMARRILVIGIAVSVLAIGSSIAVVSYSDSKLNQFSQELQQPTTTLPTTTLPLTSVLSGGATNSWIVSMTDGDDDSATVELEVGSPQPLQNGVTNGDATAGGACSLDDDTDTAIPAVIVMTNTSPDDATTVGADFSGIGQGSIPSYTGPELIWEAQYSGGAQCDGQTDGSANVLINSTDPVTSGESIDTDGFFDITNYYSPGTSDGLPGVLADSILTVPTSFDASTTSSDGSSTTTQFTVTNVTGPGVEQTDSGWEFTLAGTQPPS